MIPVIIPLKFTILIVILWVMPFAGQGHIIGFEVARSTAAILDTFRVFLALMSSMFSPAVLMAHMLVLILGGLSSGIQALRLHYVEFFLKFYHGGGTQYAPFGHKGVHIHSEIEIEKGNGKPLPQKS